MNPAVRHRFFLFAVFAAGSCLPLRAQLPVPEPPPPNADQPITLDPAAPLKSLAAQLTTAVFEQRTGFAGAFDEADRAVDTRMAALRSQGLVFADEAEANLQLARESAAQAFDHLSFSTKETWQTARHNALLAIRKVRTALIVLEQTAGPPRP